MPKLKVELLLIVYKQENEQTITQYRDLTSKVKTPKNKKKINKREQDFLKNVWV